VTPSEMTGAPEAWLRLEDPLPDWHTDPEEFGG
jgi:hypothetical protein